jgi:hypothetical protein
MTVGARTRVFTDFAEEAGEGLGGDNPGQSCLAAFGDVEIGVHAAQYHHGIGCGAPVGKEPHTPPDAGRIDDAHAPSCLNGGVRRSSWR